MVPIESPLLISYLTSFESNIIFLTIFEIFGIKRYFSIGAMVRINSTSGLADRNISDFQQKIGNHISWDSTLVKIGIEDCDL